MTILRLSGFLYGEQIRASVFEPLLADRHQELTADRSLALRLRWWFAIVSAMMCALPRAAFGQLRAAFVFDVAVRATAFFALAFALQWALGARLGPRSGARAWPPSFTTTFLFIIIPVIWRLRGEGIPVHQQRLLTFLFSTACIAVAVISVAPNAALGAAIVLATAWLTFRSWKLYTASANGTSPLGPWLAQSTPRARLWSPARRSNSRSASRCGGRGGRATT
jgi:hypothetical protein